MRLQSHYDSRIESQEAAVALNARDMDAKMEEHFGYEHRDDVEGVLATLAPDATHDVIGWPAGPSRDRQAARAFYEALFTDLSDGKTTPLRRLHGERFLVDESLWSGRAAGRPFGLEGRGRPLEFRLLHVVEFSEAGAIQREQVWVDLAAIQRALPQS